MRTTTTTTFGPLHIQYDERVLAPREWTAQQSFWAAELLLDAPPGPLLELCSGAGQIGLLTLSLRSRPGVLVDVDPTACEYARLNAAAAGLTDVEVREAPVEQAVRPGEQFAMVLVDPPYIPSALTSRFPEDPLLAIDGGTDGLDLARTCLQVVDSCLAPEGLALLQLADAGQAETLGDWLGQEDAPDLRILEVRTHGERGVIALLRR